MNGSVARLPAPGATADDAYDATSMMPAHDFTHAPAYAMAMMVPPVMMMVPSHRLHRRGRGRVQSRIGGHGLRGARGRNGECDGRKHGADRRSNHNALLLQSAG